jgi:putative transposase
MKTHRSRYHGHRFPVEIISHAVWVYHRFCLSFRDVEDLLAERGIIVSYETIQHRCQKFGPDYARKLEIGRFLRSAAAWMPLLHLESPVDYAKPPKSKQF